MVMQSRRYDSKVSSIRGIISRRQRYNKLYIPKNNREEYGWE